jgi:hypothetical protein
MRSRLSALTLASVVSAVACPGIAQEEKDKVSVSRDKSGRPVVEVVATFDPGRRDPEREILALSIYLIARDVPSGSELRSSGTLDLHYDKDLGDVLAVGKLLAKDKDEVKGYKIVLTEKEAKLIRSGTPIRIPLGNVPKDKLDLRALGPRGRAVASVAIVDDNWKVLKTLAPNLTAEFDTEPKQSARGRGALGSVQRGRRPKETEGL